MIAKLIYFFMAWLGKWGMQMQIKTETFAHGVKNVKQLGFGQDMVWYAVEGERKVDYLLEDEDGESWKEENSGKNL